MHSLSAPISNYNNFDLLERTGTGTNIWSSDSQTTSTWSSRGPSCSSSMGSTPPISPAPQGHPKPLTTLAELYEHEFNPGFLASVRAALFDNKLHIPMREMPTVANGYSVSNYMLECVITHGNVYGTGAAEESLSMLLHYVPHAAKAGLRAKLMQRVQLLNTKRQQCPLCSFCRNNGRSPREFLTHTVKDKYGRVQCPYLRQYTCPKCGACGDSAHTITYCPLTSRRQASMPQNPGTSQPAVRQAISDRQSLSVLIKSLAIA